MARLRRSLLTVLFVTCLIALRGFLPGQASAHPHGHQGCATMGETGCMDRPASPAHGSGHTHDCGTCMVSQTCLSGLALPHSIYLAPRPRMMVAAYASPYAVFLTGQQAPPDLRPPRGSLNF
ncbi:hypothetical protein [Asaia krungthepensis]|nr:hypothetical protein [Asaia krungthepensis]